MSRLNTFAVQLALMLRGDALPSVGREEGQTLAEYALILALIAAVVAGAVIFLQGSISALFSSIGNAI